MREWAGETLQQRGWISYLLPFWVTETADKVEERQEVCSCVAVEMDRARSAAQKRNGWPVQ